jgi:hypothetical protein
MTAVPGRPPDVDREQCGCWDEVVGLHVRPRFVCPVHSRDTHLPRRRMMRAEALTIPDHSRATHLTELDWEDADTTERSMTYRSPPTSSVALPPLPRLRDRVLAKIITMLAPFARAAATLVFVVMTRRVRVALRMFGWRRAG